MRYTTTLITVALLLSLSFPAFGQRFPLGTPFADDFEDGDLQDDSPVSWRRGFWEGASESIQNGDLMIQSEMGSNYLGPAYPNGGWIGFENVSVQTTFRMSGGGPDDWLTLATRVPDFSMYGIRYRANGDVRLQELDTSGFEEVKSVVETSLDASSHDVTLRIDAYDDYIRAWAWQAGTEMPSEPIGEFVDSTIQDGTIGLLVGGSARFEFTDFQVTEIIEPPYRSVGGVNSLGQLSLPGKLTDVRYNPIEGTHTGLKQHWFSIRSPRTYDEIIAQVFDPELPEASENSDVPAFQTDTTWWHGSQPAIQGLPAYPSQVTGFERVHRNEGDLWSAEDNWNYTAFLTGEIFLPEAGSYRFLDGVDDYAALGIDLDRDGFVDNDELLIDDDNWTDPTRFRNDGGHESESIPVLHVDEIAEGGEWFPIQVVVAERGGADAGVFYWDYDATDSDGDDIRIGDATGFPTSVSGEGRTIDEGAIPRLLIPQSHLRSAGGSEISGGVSVAELSSEIPGYELEIGGETSDQIVVAREHEMLQTRLDLSDATVAISWLDEVIPGEYRLFVADEIVGEAELIFSDGLRSLVDTSRLLSDGVLVVMGDGFDCDGNSSFDFADMNCLDATRISDALNRLGLVQGDANGDGNVDFGDFLILSSNFGESGSYTEGDFDGNGAVEFADFLSLSSNYGATSTASALVPEPSGICLVFLAVMGLLCRTGFFRGDDYSCTGATPVRTSSRHSCHRGCHGAVQSRPPMGASNKAIF